jgi:hypothetical protein
MADEREFRHGPIREMDRFPFSDLQSKARYLERPMPHPAQELLEAISLNRTLGVVFHDVAAVGSAASRDSMG